MKPKKNIPAYLYVLDRLGLDKTQRLERMQATVDMVEFNQSTKRNKHKIVSKLRRKMTARMGSRKQRATWLNTFPCITIKGRVVG